MKDKIHGLFQFVIDTPDINTPMRIPTVLYLVLQLETLDINNIFISVHTLRT